MISNFAQLFTLVSACQYKQGLLWFSDFPSLVSQHSLPQLPSPMWLPDLFQNFLPLCSVSVALVPSLLIPLECVMKNQQVCEHWP